MLAAFAFGIPGEFSTVTHLTPDMKLPSRLTAFVRHNWLPWSNFLTLTSQSVTAGELLYLGQEIPAGTAPDTLLGMVAKPAAVAQPGMPMLNATATYACSSPSGACTAYPSSTVTVSMTVIADSTGKAPHMFGTHCDFTPKNLSSFGINGKVTLDAGDEYTFTLVLDDPEPSREPSAQR